MSTHPTSMEGNTSSPSLTNHDKERLLTEATRRYRDANSASSAAKKTYEEVRRARKAATADLEELLVRLHAAGHSFTRLAELTGFAPQNLHRMATRHKKRARAIEETPQ